MTSSVSGLFIRPPRATYEWRALGPKLQKLSCWQGFPLIIQRRDFQVRNLRNQLLECSVYVPLGSDKKRDAPGRERCILYCHGASGNRLDGITDAWEIGMQHQYSLCVFDFSGCGLSQGKTITLGLFEIEDIRVVARELVNVFGYSNIALWGRSMGAVACIRFASLGGVPPVSPPGRKFDYSKWSDDDLTELVEDLGERLGADTPDEGARRTRSSGREALLAEVDKLTRQVRSAEAKEDTSYMAAIRCLIVDSPFSNLWSVAKHIVEHHRISVPQFMLRGLAKVGLSIVRKSILKRIPEFDIRELEATGPARKCTLPILFLHGKQDGLIPHQESRVVFDAYGADAGRGGSTESSPQRRRSAWIANRSASFVAEPPAGGDGVLQAPQKRRSLVASPRLASKAIVERKKVPKYYTIVDGDHNSLRPIKYYDAVSNFLSEHFASQRGAEAEAARPEASKAAPLRPLSVVPPKLRESKEMKFYYGVAVVSEYTDEEVSLRDEDGDDHSAPPSPTGPTSPEGAVDDTSSVATSATTAAGVSCRVRTVSCSWRMVLGLHPKRGILVFRPYSGISLYAISFAELLSFALSGPNQLIFMFLDAQKTQRRVRFFSPESIELKEQIDNSIRRLVSHRNMTSEDLVAKIKSNIAGASAALVEKHLLSSRGLTHDQVQHIIDALCQAIESMFKDRETRGVMTDEEAKEMVEIEVVRAVEKRTGWRPEIGSKYASKSGRRCVVS